jgi:hypothetical protein
MAKDWKAAITARQNDWNIPNPVLSELGSLIQTAEIALAAAQNETTRTPVACQTASRLAWSLRRCRKLHTVNFWSFADWQNSTRSG